MRTGVRFPPVPPVPKPQPFSVGAFFRLIAPEAACCRGFVRKPADFIGRHRGTVQGGFLSPEGSSRSGLALRERHEVRKGPVRHPFKSTGYARTDRASSFAALGGEGKPNGLGSPNRGPGPGVRRCATIGGVHADTTHYLAFGSHTCHRGRSARAAAAVSYTHLTLPTNREV